MLRQQSGACLETQTPPMKIVELFAHLRTHDIDKKISDPIKNVVAAYQKFFDDDDIAQMFVKYPDVLARFKESFDNNRFTLRNYLTAYRDLCRMSIVKETFISFLKQSSDIDIAEEQWEVLVGQIERDRAEYVREANALQRVRKKEKQAMSISMDSNEHPPSPEPAINDEASSSAGARTWDHGQSERLAHHDESHNAPDNTSSEDASPDNYESENRLLKERLKRAEETVIDCEKRWAIAMRCLLRAIQMEI